MITEPERIRDLPTKTDGVPHWLPASVLEWLRPVQRAALCAIYQTGGLFGPIGCGHGKTAIGWLAGASIVARRGGSVRVAVFVPAAMLGATEREYAKMAAAGITPGRGVEVVPLSYSRVSTQNGRTWLRDQGAFDLVVFDECHYLRCRSSARTMRITDWLYSIAPVAVVAMSGSIMNRSILDFAHLAEWCLGAGSPLPRPSLVNDAGALRSFDLVLSETASNTLAPEPWHYAAVARALGVDRTAGTTAMRAAFARRFESTPGVVISADASAGATLQLERIRVEPDPALSAHVDRLRGLWETPNGELLSEVAHVNAALRRLELGFYHEWRWAPDTDWLAARNGWAGAARRLAALGKPGLDTPGLIARAVDEGCTVRGVLFARAAEAWREWCRYSHDPGPPRQAVKISERIQGITLNTPSDTVIFYESQAVGRELGRLGYRLTPGDPNRPTALQWGKYGTGANLQCWCRALVLEPPTSAQTWEQLLARLHRQGQESGEVLFQLLDLPSHNAAFAASARVADTIETLTRVPQRLRFAVRLNF